MRRRLLVAAMAGGLGVTVLPLAAGPVLAATVEGSVGPREREAVTLLLQASRAARSLAYVGARRDASWTVAGSAFDIVEVNHPAGTPSSVMSASTKT